ncbi:carotenoid cleavage dioxygenase [Saccharothrix tamanrassetensis]|uniref:Dioxygenase n=1 Tax=Saccharothrix tamanrassetensis TaxID=1051531 RepID=A0A841CTN7_9PSEU|nr:carotenoid oxygenase family protein [Saccharothrix tamanrassetensis]MBB5959498.1 carotenoid cleavage dioxygenase [Saccharothrix tamanrassetensis]
MKPYLEGHYTPVPDEATATGLTVRGSLPAELRGRYLRNGHNPKPGVTPSHWFKGSGMVHGVRLVDGRAEWYRNRWVRTPALDGDTSHDLKASVAGTHVIGHAGRILALQEANLPYELTPELDTVGAFDFHGKLTTAMTAHPKEDPATGELHFFSYSPFPPHLIYYVSSTAGEISRVEVVDGAGPSLMHDFGLTENHVVWLDLPVVFDPAEQSGIPYRWSDDYRPRIGVMPRVGAPEVTWFEVEPGALLHVGNAYEDAQGRVVVEGPRYDRAAWETSWKWWVGAPGHGPEPLTGAVSHRWTLDVASGTAREEMLDVLTTEFPTINEDLLGRATRFGYAVAFPGSGHEGYSIVKYDNVSGSRQLAPMGERRMPGEAVFVPSGQGEDEGYLLTIVSDLARDTSELLVLDATDIRRDPVAVVELPRRVPAGIHGSWIPDSEPAWVMDVERDAERA